MSSRGVLYFAWGPMDRLIERSIGYLQKIHPELPYHIERLSEGSTYLDKAAMFEKSPFELTAYLDLDTVVLGNLDYAFDRAEQHGLALCINEHPWARRYQAFSGDSIEYNAGVMFFDKLKSKPVFDAWRECVRTIDSSVMFHGDGGLTRQEYNDQAGLTKAIEDTGFCPWVLPHNWNFRIHWHSKFVGPVKIWHDYMDPPDALIEHSQRNEHARIMDLVQFSPEQEEAEEEPAPEGSERLKVACAMSVPRLGFQDNFFCWVKALGPLGIQPVKYDGAFWGQCLERVMTAQLDADLILTVDYDSVFTKEDVERMLYLAAKHPEADAIASIQARRGTGLPLVSFRGADGELAKSITRDALAGELTQCESAHFGLTLFRTEALKRMPHPWFLGVPDSDGTWGENHVDDDVYFWRKWKATGNKLFLANRVAIGHMETVVTWPDINLEPKHQPTHEFHERGKPQATWE